MIYQILAVLILLTYILCLMFSNRQFFKALKATVSKIYLDVTNTTTKPIKIF